MSFRSNGSPRPVTPRKKPSCQRCGRPRKGHARDKCPDKESPRATDPADLTLAHCQRCHVYFQPESPGGRCIVPHVFNIDRRFQDFEDNVSGRDDWYFRAECCSSIEVKQHSKESDHFAMEMLQPACHFEGEHTTEPLSPLQINKLNMLPCWLDEEGRCKRQPIPNNEMRPVWTEE